jgi:hypothetical protein
LERRDKEIMLLKTALEASKSDLEASEENASILQFNNDRLREEIAALKASEDTRNNRAAARPTLVHLSTTAVPHHVSSASDATETGAAVAAVAAGAVAVKVSTLVGLAVRPCCSSRSTLPMRSHRGSDEFGCCSDFVVVGHQWIRSAQVQGTLKSVSSDARYVSIFMAH